MINKIKEEVDYASSTIVKTKSFEEINGEIQEQKKQLEDWNNGLKGSGNYKTSLKKEMNLNSGPCSLWLGKGTLY